MIQGSEHLMASCAESPAIEATLEVASKRTCDLSLQECDQFCELFRRVFRKSMDRNAFDRKYRKTPIGYSHHGLMMVKGQIVGAYSLIPYQYRCFGRECLFGLSVDAMIDERHRRGPFNLLRMAQLACEEAARDGVVFVFGFPNDQAYAFVRRVLRWTGLGELDFYVLPIRIGAVRPLLAWANALSRFISIVWIRLPRWSRAGPSRFPVEKICDEGFRRHRYGEQHGAIALKAGGEATYCIHEEDDGVRVLYIVDVTPLKADAFAEAVRKLHGVAMLRADLILYVGRLPFAPRGLIRVPLSMCPRPIRMCGKILDPRGVDERVLQMENWNINISNFDVR